LQNNVKVRNCAEGRNLTIKYEYGDVEKAFAAVYGVDDAVRQGPFRARITNAQKLGIFGAKPGKGVREAYGVTEMEKLLFFLELSELAFTPALISALIDTGWDDPIGPIFRTAQGGLVTEEPGGSDIILVMGSPAFTTGPWAAQPYLPQVNSCKLRDLAAQVEDRMSQSTPPPRLIAINLSDRLRVFHIALIAASDGGRRVLIDGEEVPSTRETRALLALREQIAPLKIKFGTADGLTSEQATQLGRLLQREARLRDKLAKPVEAKGVRRPRQRKKL
jgi:hypothetical protein